LLGAAIEEVRMNGIGNCFLACFSAVLVMAPVNGAWAQSGKLTRLRAATTSASPSNWALLTGQKQGFFAAEGIELEALVLRGSTLQTQALLTDGVQINAYTVDTAARAVSAGAPLKLVASNQEKPTFRVVVHKDIHQWAGLKGRHIAAGSPGGTYYAVLMAMLDANGIKKGEVSVISIGNSNARVTAMRAGTVQAAIVAQPEDLVLMEAGFKVMGSTGEYLKEIQYQGFVVHEPWAQANENTLVRFLRAVRKSLAWLHNPSNKEAALDILSRHVRVKREWLEQSYELLINKKYLSTDGRPDAKGIQNMLALTMKYGTERQNIPPLDRWVDLTYMDKAAR
jgi:ABC-type nitrate/sulfonate/bicarbonate transport system substrate-binding protein